MTQEYSYGRHRYGQDEGAGHESGHRHQSAKLNRIKADSVSVDAEGAVDSELKAGGQPTGDEREQARRQSPPEGIDAGRRSV
jgi:hypothetical protein